MMSLLCNVTLKKAALAYINGNVSGREKEIVVAL